MLDVPPGSATDHQSGSDYDWKSCKMKYSEKIVFLIEQMVRCTYTDLKTKLTSMKQRL